MLMWEIFALGKSPYAGMTNARAREWIEEGKGMTDTGRNDVVGDFNTNIIIPVPELDRKKKIGYEAKHPVYYELLKKLS